MLKIKIRVDPRLRFPRVHEPIFVFVVSRLDQDDEASWARADRTVHVGDFAMMLGVASKHASIEGIYPGVI